MATVQQPKRSSGGYLPGLIPAVMLRVEIGKPPRYDD